MTQKPAEKPVVLITGASAGIGAATARRFADAGYSVVAVARGQERLERLASELRAKTEIVTVAVDVMSAGAAERSVGAAMENFGRLDCLVNNAASEKWAPIDQIDDETIDEVISFSLKAPIQFCRAALGKMRRGSSIINIGSTFGIVGGLNGGVYSVVKAGLIGLTQTMAAQYGAAGIRSNLVAPGPIKTDMTKDYWDAPAFRRLNHEMTPIDREGTPEDIANAVYFLASKEGSYINGQTLALDGGWTTTRYLTPEALTVERVPGPPK